MVEKQGLSRRGLLQAATSSALGLSVASCNWASAEDNALAAAGGRATPGHTGEPYELPGKRLIFTNWHYIRPGAIGWFDAQGNDVKKKAQSGPWDGSHRRLDSPYGIRLVAQEAERLGPLLQGDRPWENVGLALMTIIHDDGIYRAWGHCAGTSNSTLSRHGCYLESKDGITWERPNLGLVEYDGSRKNNLLPIAFPDGSVFKDPSGSDEERYKAVFQVDASAKAFEAYRKRRPNDWQQLALDADPGRIHAVHGAVSPDGIHWKALAEPIVVEHSDTQNTCYYDDRLRKYVLYTRNYPLEPRSEKVPYDASSDPFAVGRRCIGRSESEDFRDFPISKVMLEPTPDMLPSDMLYLNSRTSIPAVHGHHLMFPAVWHNHNDTFSILLASSCDGRVWHYIPGSPVLRTSTFGQWDGGMVFSHPNLLELPDGRFALPYTGFNMPHNRYATHQSWQTYAPGYAIWPKSRFVALEAPQRGECATVGIVPPGRNLRINAVVERAGAVSIEVADLAGKPIPGRTFADCTPIVGDHYWTTVTWKGHDDLGHHKDTAIMLRFQMDQAQIFGLEFV